MKPTNEGMSPIMAQIYDSLERPVGDLSNEVKINFIKSLPEEYQPLAFDILFLDNAPYQDQELNNSLLLRLQETLKQGDSPELNALMQDIIAFDAPTNSIENIGEGSNILLHIKEILNRK